MQTQSAGRSSPLTAPALLNRFPAAAPANQDSADRLDALGSIQSVRAGSEVFSEGDQVKSWFRVQSGVLLTCKLLSDGRRQIEDFLFPGDFFGLETREEHGFSAEAVTAATVIRYSRARIENLAIADARVGAQLLSTALKHLDKAHNRSLLLGRKNAEEKVASFLLEMLDRSDKRDTIDLAMSRTHIADYLGLTIETVSRIFSALKQRSVIALPNGRQVIIRKRDLLENLTGN